MTRSTATHAEAAERFDALTTVCVDFGLGVVIVERPHEVKISSPGAHARMAEVITLRPDAEGVLAWFWSWGEVIAPARDLRRVVELLTHVTSGREL
jgi:hypothetical protein